MLYRKHLLTMTALCVFMVATISDQTTIAGGPTTKVPIDVKTIVFVSDIGKPTATPDTLTPLTDVLTKRYHAKAFRLEPATETKLGQFGKVLPATLLVKVVGAQAKGELVRIEKKSDCPNNSTFQTQATQVTVEQHELRPLFKVWTRLAHKSVGGLKEATTVHEVERKSPGLTEYVLVLASK